ALHRGPGALHPADRLDPARIAVDEFLPERAAGGEAVVPPDAVEPEEEVFGRRLAAREAVADGRVVLPDGVAAGGGAVEAEAVRVGPVVVDAAPVRTSGVLGVEPGPGPVVVPDGHEM